MKEEKREREQNKKTKRTKRNEMAISILYPPWRVRQPGNQDTFFETSNCRKIARMAPISTIFGPIESRRCQLNLQKQITPSKNFSRGGKKSKNFAKSSKKLSRFPFRAKNKIETAKWRPSSAVLWHRSAGAQGPSDSACFPIDW